MCKKISCASSSELKSPFKGKHQHTDFVSWGFNDCEARNHAKSAKYVAKRQRARRQKPGFLKNISKGFVGQKGPTKRELKLAQNKPVWYVIIFVSKIKMAWAGSRAIDLFENYNWS